MYPTITLEIKGKMARQIEFCARDPIVQRIHYYETERRKLPPIRSRWDSLEAFYKRLLDDPTFAHTFLFGSFWDCKACVWQCGN